MEGGVAGVVGGVIGVVGGAFGEDSNGSVDAGEEGKGSVSKRVSKLYY